MAKPADESLQPALIDAVVEAARRAEVALIFAALPASKESEGYDRTDLDLTAQQVALIKAVDPGNLIDPPIMPVTAKQVNECESSAAVMCGGDVW